MGMTKNYLLKVLENCSENQFGQDTVEWAIISGRLRLAGDLQTDLRAIMGEPGEPPVKYDELIEAYRRVCADNEAAMMDAFAQSGLLEEILRPAPLAHLHKYETTHISSQAR